MNFHSKGWAPKGFQENADNGRVKIRPDLAQLTANEAVKTRRFWMLWMMLFINVTCGIALLAVASPMAQELTGMSAVSAAAMVGIMGLFNGGGRIAWATVSDYIGRPNVYTTFFVIQIAAYFLLNISTSQILFMTLLYAVMTTYGAGFSCIPAYIGDIFGTKQLGAIHGYILTAWAAAGIVGPLLISLVYDRTQSYSLTLSIFVGMFAVALAISIWIRADIKRLRDLQNQELAKDPPKSLAGNL